MRFPFLAVVVLLLGGACGGDGSSPTLEPPAPTPSTGATAPATQPPPPGGVKLVPFLKGLDQPVDMRAIPRTDRLAIVEKGGVVRIAEAGRLTDATLLDIRDQVSTGSEQGLLSIAFPPDYQEGGEAYVDYTDVNGDTHIARLDTSNGSLSDIIVIPQPYSNHNGGALEFGPDGKLYVGMGDGGSGGDPEGNGQDRTSLLGKILRFDVSQGSPEPEQFAYGLRNPWRFSFDGEDLWIGDVGQGAWEEVDRIDATAAPGANLGWNAYEGNAVFERQQIDDSRLVFPVAQYSHELGCSITGGFVYRGSAVPALRGRYVYGDYCSGLIWALPADGGSPTLLDKVEVPGLSSFAVDARGEMYALSLDGSIQRFAAAG
jgi:glucose/arabinose dehydrogenase